MKKKLFAVALSALVLPLTFSLTSCGDSVENAGEAFKLLSIDDLKAKSSEASPIKVEFWHSFGHNISNQLTPLIEEFEEEMAAKNIYIDVVTKQIGGGYDGLRSRVNQGTKSNSIPTMILGYPDHFADYIGSGILLPLDDFVNSSDKENIGFTQEEIENDFVTTYWNENQLIGKDGKTITAGIPFNKSTEVMYYNASAVDPILEKNGWLKDGQWVNPTWEQLWTVSAELREKSLDKTLSWKYNGATYNVSIKTPNQFYPVYIDSKANFFITTARQWAADLTAASQVYTKLDSTGKGVVCFDNETTKAAQNYFIEKANAGLWNVPDKVNQSYGSNLMVNNEAFISIGSTAGVNNNDSSKYEMKVTTIPQKSYDNGVQAVIQQGTNATILTKNSNNYTRLAAWLLIRHLTSTNVTARFSMNTGYLPVRNSARQTTDFKDFIADTNSIFGGATAQAVVAADAQANYFYTDPAFSGSSIVRDVVDTMVQTIYCQGKEVGAAMESAYSKLRDYRLTCE